jgi:FlgD Ig-like domain
MTTRFPLAAFATLVVATVAAFFITQHLKVSTPLLAGTPAPFPAAINPVSGVTCYQPAAHKYVNHREMQISFYLLNRSDRVDVYVVDQAGRLVATLASGRYMQGGSHPARSQFVWDGRESSGAVAPDGTYLIRVRLIGQRRTVTISGPSGPKPVTVKTTPPQPVVTAVVPKAITRTAPTPVKISYTGNENRDATVLIYRLDAGRRPLLVKSFLTKGQSATWDGLIHKRPAPVGTYLIGLQVTDAACNTGRFPADLYKLSPGDAAAELTVGQ